MSRQLAWEQKRALAYLRLKGKESSLDSLVQRIRATVSTLDGALEGVAPDEAAVRPAPGAWSVHEIVDHLAETNRCAIEELASLLRGEVPAGGPIPAGLLSDDPFARSWPQAVAALASTHERFLELLAGASDDVPQEARAPLVMVVKVPDEAGVARPLEWIEELDWKSYAIALRAHTLEHVGQIRRTLEAVRAARG